MTAVTLNKHMLFALVCKNMIYLLGAVQYFIVLWLKNVMNKCSPCQSWVQKHKDKGYN